MDKKHIIRALENTPVDIGDTLYQVIDCETPYIREITVTGFRCEPDGVAMMCRAEDSGRDVRLDVERWGADVFESKADAERSLAGLKARRGAAPDGFDLDGRHCRVTIGDMWQQTRNDYGDGYSNVITHPDGRVGVNWN